MIQRILGTLRRIFRDVAVISDRTTAYAFLHVPVFSDLLKERGPVAGIHSALVHARTERVLVVPCDMPYLSEELIRYVVNVPVAGDACVLEAEGFRNPLCGLYHRRILPVIEQEIRAGHHTPQHLLDLVEARSIVISPDMPFYTPRLLANINDPESLREATLEPEG
jgi:molybdopterin-guanine dinucleotide biosynthesis protein A